MSDYHEGRGVTIEEFHKIKYERSAEIRNTAEARRQHHLQQIRELKSRTGIHPLDRFPKEIWEKIFEFLSPKDLGAISEVHDLFQQQISKRRVPDVLLPQILNLKFTPSWNPELDPKDEGYFNGNDSYDHEIDQEWEDRMPLADVEMGEFVRLRQVSKSLRNNIDQLFENMIIRSLRSEKEIKIEAFMLPFPDEEENDKDLKGLLENFSVGSNKARRFFLRSLKVCISVDSSNSQKVERNLLGAFSEFKFKVTKLLEIIGEQIWRFEIQIYYWSGHRRVPISEIYIALTEWTDLLPNLKWLVLDSEEDDRDLPYNADNVLQNEEDEIQEDDLSNVSQNFPIPRLGNLVRICCHFKSKDYKNIFNIFALVLRANPHVKALNVLAGMDTENIDLFFIDHFNPLLVSLPLDLDVLFMNHDQYLPIEECLFNYIHPVVNPKWPLKRMHLGCNIFNIRLRSVFELLLNFQTLEHLMLVLVGARFENDIPFLKLPNLTHLKLEVSYDGYDNYVMEYTPATNFFFSLQFLLFAKKLKKLEWKLGGWHASIKKLRRYLVNHESYEQCVNFRAGMRDLRSSNLWDVFPRLEEVVMEFQRIYRHSEMFDEKQCKRTEKF